MAWWQWMGIVSINLTGIAFVARGWIGWNYPARIDRGKIARALQRRFGLGWPWVDVGFLEIPLIASALSAGTGWWPAVGPLFAWTALYSWARVIDDWLVDDDDRWKRRRARARDRLRWRGWQPVRRPARAS